MNKSEGGGQWEGKHHTRDPKQVQKEFGLPPTPAFVDGLTRDLCRYYFEI